ncbi:hypothetical protein MCOR27_011616 [Pyricularia oryzae]|uniref:ABC-type Fe3+ transport system n=1 Tax=Pyricularia grisea TaxID=148305 RepID=A0ABQ8NHM0_PYRGI|nr:hypothetical protein MCOR01_005495 [Pyricularia oryzae]KAI6297226.1 hypothetical protein MCOR33_006363 [Pyricularia grisea]KAI6261863.1 hypothetical protein MCOR19_001947 [Pyricularia oryzae]KAI6264806.1 hypothetical protein MCOR27_011616 [Pyricularia oryzae]KAI6277744.1 hypothetical protein MCOR26_004946 [Pyricularia oryzae]
MRAPFALTSILFGCAVQGCDRLLGFKPEPETETRSLEELHQAALAEGGVVTVWHGGDEKTQQDATKAAFEARFPGMTLNMTVDVSKYHDSRLDEELAKGGPVTPDSIILQTLHDYPRWAQQGALLNYKPQGFDGIPAEAKDSATGAWHGVFYISWRIVANPAKTNGLAVEEFDDFLKPELKGKIVLTYPNDDDAVLWAFHLIMQQKGIAWFDALLAQKPRWVRGTATPSTIAASPDHAQAVSFTTSGGRPALASTYPTRTNFVAWPQTAGILRDARHPEGARLFHNWLLSRESQETQDWPLRTDVAPLPNGFPLDRDIANVANTNAAAFLPWMRDRVSVERLKLWFETKIGTPQGLSPLEDDL